MVQGGFDGNEALSAPENLETSRLFDGDVRNRTYSAIPNIFGAKQIRRSRKRSVTYMGLFSLLLIVAFSLLNTYLVIAQGQDYLNQAVEVDIQHVELVGVTTKGLKVKVQGLNTINYDEIDSKYFRNLLKLSSGIFQSVGLDLESVELQTIIDDNIVNIGRVDVPNKIQVDIRNNQGSEFDLDLLIHPATSKILGLIKELLLHPNQAFKFFGSTFLNIKLGYIPIGGFRVNFEQEFVGHQYFDFKGDSININDLIFTEIDNKYMIDLRIDLPNPVRNKFFVLHVPELSWSLKLDDCDHNPTINLFDYPIFSDSFKLSPLDESLSINLSTAITHLDSKFVTKCSDDKVSKTPLSIVADQFINNKTFPVLLKNVEGSKEYPSFLNEILKGIDFRFDYLSDFEANHLIYNVSIDHLKFEFANGDMNKPVISGDINLFLSLPKGLTKVGISDIRGTQTLFHSEVPFAKINLDKWHPCENELIEDESLLWISFKLIQEEVNIINNNEFGKVLNEILKTSSSKVSIDAILDCLTSSLLGEFEIDNIHAKSDSYLTRGIVFKNL